MLIKIDKLEKVYGKSEAAVVALNKVDLNIKKGEFISIMGPSGCGKSTLLNMIGCIDKPTGGNVLIDNIDIGILDYDSLANLRNKKVAFVFQNFALLNNFTVIENVMIPLRIRKLTKNEMVIKAETVLKKLDIYDKRDKKVSELSGGQQQRVAIARALGQDTDIILADEPTGALDQENGAIILDILRELNSEYNKTIIVVTHDQMVADKADRIIRMRNGKILSDEVI